MYSTMCVINVFGFVISGDISRDGYQRAKAGLARWESRRIDVGSVASYLAVSADARSAEYAALAEHRRRHARFASFYDLHTFKIWLKFEMYEKFTIWVYERKEEVRSCSLLFYLLHFKLAFTSLHVSQTRFFFII